MSVRAGVLMSTSDVRHQIVLGRPDEDDSLTLEHEVHLGAGVRLVVDLARPGSWRRLSITDWSAAALPLVAAVAGKQASHDLGDVVHQHPPAEDSDEHHVDVDPTQAGPWVQLAVIQALDRWLHRSLDQALLQAETGVAMLWAARSLPADAEVRGTLIDEALGWARRAADGFTRFLHDLDASRRPLPPALHRSIRDLVEGYRGLREQVDEPDSGLDAVLTGWQAVAKYPLPDPDGRHRTRLHRDVVSSAPSTRLGVRVVSMIDPRHVRARVLGLGSQARAGEISLVKAYDEGSVRVRVAAFERLVDPEIAQRLMARLVSRRSGRAVGFAPLVMRAGSGTKSRPPFFECTMPLNQPLEDLRADVYDALFRAQLVKGDTEEDLLRVRRAVLLLREWRGLVARAWLRSGDGRPDSPAPDELAGDELSVLRELPDAERRSAVRLLPAMTRGPGRPLVAELAAAHEDQAA